MDAAAMPRRRRARSRGAPWRTAYAWRPPGPLPYPSRRKSRQSGSRRICLHSCMRFVRLAAGFAALAFLGGGALAQKAGGTVDPVAGISLELARDRAARIADLRYDLSFSIPMERTAPIAGR